MPPPLRWFTRLLAYGLFCLLDHGCWVLIQLLSGHRLMGLARERPWRRWQSAQRPKNSRV